MKRNRHLLALGLVTTLFLPAAKGEGCNGTAFSTSPAPDMTGQWDVEYDDRLDVEITIGGAVYEASLGATGGVVDINHEGQPFQFDLDCAREDVVCPSEVWPAAVGFRQDDPRYTHRVWMQVPKQVCDAELVDPEPTECGEGTANPDCEQVCSGEMVTEDVEAFGTIDEAGESFQVGLGAGVATNGVNCALIGGSYAQGELETTGGEETEDWTAISTTGDVVAIYTGACLWVADANMDGENEALALGATVRFATGFTAKKR